MIAPHRSATMTHAVTDVVQRAPSNPLQLSRRTLIVAAERFRSNTMYGGDHPRGAMNSVVSVPRQFDENCLVLRQHCQYDVVAKTLKPIEIVPIVKSVQASLHRLTCQKALILRCARPVHATQLIDDAMAHCATLIGRRNAPR